MDYLDTIKGLFPRSFKRNLKRLLGNLSAFPAYYQLRKKPTVAKNKRHFIFICKGNICRSAFAEHYFRQVIACQAIIIESCGLDVDQGHAPPPLAVQTAKEFGVLLNKHHSKGLSDCDLENADVIVLMEFRQLMRFNSLYPQLTHKSMLIRAFLPWPGNLLCNVYDPYGLGEPEFRRCFKTIKKALDRVALDISAKK